MGRALTNNFSLAYAIQSAFNVFTTVAGSWKLTEPNVPNTFGGDITTVQRQPLSKNRQARKGTPTDLDAAVEFEADLTMDSFIDFIEGFGFSVAANFDTVFPPRSGLRAAAEGDVTATGYTIPSATAAQAAKFQFDAVGGPASLIFARGYLTDGNNGLKDLTADLIAAGTELIASGLAVETAPANAEVAMAGIRAEAGDLALAISGKFGTLTSNNAAAPANPIDFLTLGWTPGQLIHIGGLLDANRFGDTGSSAKSFGAARLVSIDSATQATFDKLAKTLKDSDGTDTGSGGTEVRVDLLYGRFIRNVPVDDADFLEKIFLFEGSFPNLFETDPPTPLPEPDGFEYVENCFCNVIAWSMPLTDKMTATFGFVGTFARDFVDNAGRQTGADTPVDPIQTTAFSTAGDFIRLRIQDVDETGLTTDFKDTTFTMDNLITPEKVLGFFGSKFINIGNLGVTLEGNILFSSPLVINRIRNNDTVTMDYIVQNDDGAIGVDIPSMTLGGGAREFPVNETIQVALTGTAFQDDKLGTSFGVSLFPVFPKT